jgi:hypothetical protein
MKYYYIDTHEKRDIPKKYFIDIFKKNPLWEYSQWDNIKNKKCSFSYSISKDHYSETCDIGFKFKPSHRLYLTTKSNLYHTLKKESDFIVKNIMLPTYDVDINSLDSYKDFFKKEKILILRPTWGFARKSILIFNDFNKFKHFMINEGVNEIKKAQEKNNQKINEKYILTKFIEGDLYNGYVFNIRLFMLVSLINDEYYCSYFENHIVHLGDIKYKDGLKNINTHKVAGLISGSIDDIKFNKYLESVSEEKGEYIKKQIDYIIKVIFHIIKKNKYMKNYENYNNCYEIFGIDLMITKDYHVILVEMNDKTGLYDYDYEIYTGLTYMIADLTINKLYEDKYHIKIPSNIKFKRIE